MNNTKRSTKLGRRTDATTQANSRKHEATDLDRAIFVTGDITDEMVIALTPKIISLTQNSGSPITVFIDSYGGDVQAAHFLLGLLRSPDHSGQRCKLRTVATGRACSAAADLLSQGDYIEAYPHAILHFHGTRFLKKEDVTAEYARDLEKDLHSEDKSRSVRLAASVLPRQLHNYKRLKSEMRVAREKSPKTFTAYEALAPNGGLDVPAFIYALSDKLGRRYGKMVWDCLDQTENRAAIINAYRSVKVPIEHLPPPIHAALKQYKIPSDAAESIAWDILLLNSVFANRIKTDPKWSPSSEEFDLLQLELEELQAVAGKIFQTETLDQLLLCEEQFMSAGDRQFCARYGESKHAKLRKKADEIIDRAYTKIEPLWAFTVKLCGELNKGENRLSPEDAWWLGLIDEVIGTPTTRRELPEKVRASLLKQMPLAEAERYV